MKLKHTLVQLIIIITVLLSQNFQAAAQNKTAYHINGIIADSATQKPLAMITIRLKDANNETVKVVVSKDDGSFTLSSIAPASYWLSINAIGYGSMMLPVDSTAFRSNTIDLKIIWLSDRMTALKGVIVTAERPIIRQKADRIIYDLKADPESKSNTLLTILVTIALAMLSYTLIEKPALNMRKHKFKNKLTL